MKYFALAAGRVNKIKINNEPTICAATLTLSAKTIKKITEYSAALKKLGEEFGEERVNEFRNNARAIVNGDNVQLNWRPLKKRRNIFRFFKM